MIAEDYVSFETAKLLKDRGFDEYVTRSYFENDGCYAPCDPSEVKRKDVIAIPTLQMAMKWLRNKYDIVCSVGLFTDFLNLPPYWSFNILNQSTANAMYEAFDVKCETYEEAAEAAIKYCLENLI